MIGWKKQFDGKYWIDPLLEEIAVFETQKNVEKISGKESNYIVEYMEKKDGKQNFINFRHDAGIKEDSKYYYNLFIKKKFIKNVKKLFENYKKNEFKLRNKLFDKEKVSFQFFKEMFLKGYSITKFTDPSTLKIIEEKIKLIYEKKLNKNNEILSELNSFHELNKLKKEELELLKLALLIKNKEKYSEKLENIQYNFGFLEYVSNYEIISKKIFLEKAKKYQELTEFEIINKINKLENYPNNFLNYKKYLYKKYKLSKEEIYLFQINSYLAYIRLELRFMWIPYFCEMHNFIKRLSKKTKIKKEFFLSLRLKEFEKYLETGKLEKKNIPRTALLFKDRKKKYIFLNNDAKKMAKILEIPLEIPKLNKLKGDIANKGKIEGEVFVLDWDKDHKKNMRKMKKGQILVVTQTKPDMMDAIRKSSGIITNEGGMISHAAIISRELKLPCLMNTKYATEILKTGNRVVLDCQKGEVYKK